jgi:hypothetical protein
MDLFQIFLRLKVIPFSTEVELKLETLQLYRRKKELHKVFGAYAPLLLRGRLTAVPFVLMCAVYDVPVLLVEGKVCFRWGTPTHVVRDRKIVPLFNEDHLFEIRVPKPLYAVTYYTLAELTEMAHQLGLHGETKKVLYDQIKDYVNLMLK